MYWILLLFNNETWKPHVSLTFLIFFFPPSLLERELEFLKVKPADLHQEKSKINPHHVIFSFGSEQTDVFKCSTSSYSVTCGILYFCSFFIIMVV